MSAIFSSQEIAAALASRTGWSSDGRVIRKTFALPNFAAAIGFVNAVAVCAETADHHPDILIHGYKLVDVMLSTHSAGGITKNDLHLAATIDALIA